eukprot:gene31420-6592_t
MASGQTKFCEPTGRPMYHHIPSCNGLTAAIELINVKEKCRVVATDLMKAFLAWPVQDVPGLSVHCKVSQDGVSICGYLALEALPVQDARLCRGCVPNKYRPIDCFMPETSRCCYCSDRCRVNLLGQALAWGGSGSCSPSDNTNNPRENHASGSGVTNDLSPTCVTNSDMSMSTQLCGQPSQPNYVDDIPALPPPIQEHADCHQPPNFLPQLPTTPQLSQNPRVVTAPAPVTAAIPPFHYSNTRQQPDSNIPASIHNSHTNPLSPSSVPVGLPFGFSSMISHLSIALPESIHHINTGLVITSGGPGFGQVSTGFMQQDQDTQRYAPAGQACTTTVTPDRNQNLYYLHKVQGGEVQVHSSFAADRNLRQPPFSGGGVGAGLYVNSVVNSVVNSEDPNHLGRAGPPTLGAGLYVNSVVNNYRDLNHLWKAGQPEPVSEQHPDYPSSNASLSPQPEETEPLSSSPNAAAATVEADAAAFCTASMDVQGQHLWYQQNNQQKMKHTARLKRPRRGPVEALGELVYSQNLSMPEQDLEECLEESLDMGNALPPPSHHYFRGMHTVPREESDDPAAPQDLASGLKAMSISGGSAVSFRMGSSVRSDDCLLIQLTSLMRTTSENNSDGHVDVHYIGGGSMRSVSMAEASGSSGNTWSRSNPSGVAAQYDRWRSKDLTTNAASGVAAQYERWRSKGSREGGICDMSSSDHSSARRDVEAMEAINAMLQRASAGVHGMQHCEGGPITELYSSGRAVQGNKPYPLLKTQRMKRQTKQPGGNGTDAFQLQSNPLDDPMHPLASPSVVNARQEGYMEMDSLERLRLCMGDSWRLQDNMTVTAQPKGSEAEGNVTVAPLGQEEMNSLERRQLQRLTLQTPPIIT